jgi:SAM-dependent methyltransferase
VLDAIDTHLAGRRDTIVDLGPGNGAVLRLAAGLGFTDLVAVDQQPRDPSFVQGLAGVRFLNANFNEQRFLGELEEGSVDVVISNEVLEHVFNHPWGYLLEAWRPLRPGGLFVLTTPNPCTLANATRLVLGRPFQWGDEWFAKTPKIENGQLTSYPFVHFREYPPAVFRALVAELPGAEIVAGGFVANAGVPWESRWKAASLNLLHGLGLGDRRLVSHTQYAVARKR